MQKLQDFFLLDPNIIYLNHGSFGACPRPVFEVYQEWQRELEKQPVEFLDRRFGSLILDSRIALASYLHANSDDLVFFSNPTTALNMVLKSLVTPLNPYLLPGDEILITDHEYGAIERALRYVCRLSGVRLIHQPLPLPLVEPEEIVDLLWRGVSPRTKLILVSHITSPTAVILPVDKICRRAREAGIITVIDGAHAPGQLTIDLSKIDADIYTGACHKWLCSPKGSAFLYARRETQHFLDPLVVSWGYESDNPSHSRFLDLNQWQGTRDIAAFLSVPSAIEFQEKHNWHLVRQTCHQLAVYTRDRINEITGCKALCSDKLFIQMVAIQMPPSINISEVKKYLWDKNKIEIPLYNWKDQKVMRLSVQAYNTQRELDVLIRSLEDISI